MNCFKINTLINEFHFSKDVLQSLNKDEFIAIIMYIFDCINLSRLHVYSNILSDIYEMYDKTLPFHNQRHAIEVLYMGVCLLVKNHHILRQLSDTEKFTFCMGLLCHDINHKGYTNAEIEEYGIASFCDIKEECSEYIFSSSSYNEHIHLKCEKELLYKYKLKYDKLLFHNLIYFSDLKLQDVFLNNQVLMSSKQFSLILFLKIADIGHILRPWNIHKQWVISLNKERNSKLSLKYLPKDTINFNKKFLLPLLLLLKKNNKRLYKTLMSSYNKNIDNWYNIQNLCIF